MACGRSILLLVAVLGSVQLARSQGCDATYTEYTGTISSPNYPNNYPVSTTCNYIIDTTGLSMRIEFQDVQIEPGYDFLYYGVGTTPDLDNYLGVITGITSPLPVDIPNGQVWFQFISDDVEVLTGFSLTWAASDEALPTTPGLTTIPPTKPYATPDPVLDLELFCDANSMTVVFNKNALFPSTPDPSEVTLTNSSCVGYYYGSGNDTDLIAVTTDYNECGTTLQETPDHVVYRNRVLFGSDPDNLQLNGGLECRLARHLQAEAASNPIADNVHFTQVGYGNFTFELDFYPDSGYGSPYGPGDYPLEAEVGSDLFVETRVETNTNLDLLAEACWVTDSPDQNDEDILFLISSGCAKDPSVTFYEGPLSSQRFSFAANVFPDGDAMLYLHCELLTCDAALSDTRCKQGCLSRKRRSLYDNLELHVVSSMPISLGRS